ncbi:MAG: helix-turn-helix domain-containing protein [Lachnospiraceae bacterium]|nr:helix-turn-helix domain-containing protein [Lachnospiraceae bacterium]
MLTTLGKFLRRLRLDRDEILKDMAEKLSVTSSFLSSIENGKKKMPNTVKDKLLKCYTLSESELEEFEKALLESNDTVEINIADTTSQKKDLAIAFARSFDNLNDDDIRIFTEFLSKRQHGGGENG